MGLRSQMRTLVCLFVLLSGALAGPSWNDEMAVRDSLRQMPRWEQVRWLSALNCRISGQLRK